MPTHQYEGPRIPRFDILSDQDVEQANQSCKGEHMQFEKCDNRYDSLCEVLTDAFDQASKGKGENRHGDDRPFEQQQYCRDLRDLGIAPGIYQIRKKALESNRLSTDEAAYQEMLGVIIYAAGVCIELKRRIKEHNS